MLGWLPLGVSSVTPAASSSDWVWNWDWSCGSGSAAPPDLGACSGCNYSITVRVLSPGDDGSLTQSTSTTLTSAAGGHRLDFAGGAGNGLAGERPSADRRSAGFAGSAGSAGFPRFRSCPSRLRGAQAYDPPWPVGGSDWTTRRFRHRRHRFHPETAPPPASDTGRRGASRRAPRFSRRPASARAAGRLAPRSLSRRDAGVRSGGRRGQVRRAAGSGGSAVSGGSRVSGDPFRSRRRRMGPWFSTRCRAKR